jgi:hypothetical protein
MNPADFTSNTVTFHWVDGSDNSLFPVECKATVAGEEMSAVTYFNVLRPSAEWTAEFRDVVTVDANYANPGVWLHFGGKTNDGIFFTMSNVNLKGYLGSYAFSCVQLMDTTALMNVTNTGTTPPSPQYSIQTVYSGMDADEPYKFEDFGQVKWAQTEDSPGSPLGFPIYQYSRTDSAEMFLMFQPQAPSIPVPLRSISWTWSGTATNFPWGLNSSPTNRAITAINPNVTQHPFWTNSHLKSRVSTTNNGW